MATKLRNILCRVKAWLLLQIQVYRVLVLTISSVWTIGKLRGGGATAIEGFLFLNVLRHGVVLIGLTWVPPRWLLLHFTPIVHGWQYSRLVDPSWLYWNARNFIHILYDERSRVLFRRCPGIIGCVIGTDRESLFVTRVGTRTLSQLLFGNAIRLAHSVFRVAQLLAFYADISADGELISRLSTCLLHERVFILHFNIN